MRKRLEPSQQTGALQLNCQLCLEAYITLRPEECGLEFQLRSARSALSSRRELQWHCGTVYRVAPTSTAAGMAALVSLAGAWPA